MSYFLIQRRKIQNDRINIRNCKVLFMVYFHNTISNSWSITRIGVENNMNDNNDFEEEPNKPASNLLPSDHGERWSEHEIKILLEGLINGKSWTKLAEIIHRKPSAIKSKFGNIIIEKINNIDMAKILLSSGSPEPNRDPKKSISGVGGERPSDDRCSICSSLLGPRCMGCGNTVTEDDKK